LPLLRGLDDADKLLRSAIAQAHFRSIMSNHGDVAVVNKGENGR
jgi:hypothetical protein